MRRKLFVALSLFGVAGALAAQQRDDRPPPTLPEIRAILREREPDSWAKLTPFGERLFPAFEAVLNDPKVTDYEAQRVFTVLGSIKADRSRFVDLVARWLTMPEMSARRHAIYLLGSIGTRKDTPLIVAQLWDPDVYIVHAALNALEKLGGEPERVALDIWIKAKTEDLRAAEQVRDALRKRAEEEKKKKGG